jgi:hypothetical protein
VRQAGIFFSAAAVDAYGKNGLDGVNAFKEKNS